MNSNQFKKSIFAALLLLSGLAATADVTLTWNPAPVATLNPVVKYSVYWGTTSGIYLFGASAGLKTNLTVTGLNPGTVYYFAVTATRVSGLESLDSNEAAYTNAPAVTPPTPPMAGATNGGAGGAGMTGNAAGGGAGNGGAAGAMGANLAGGTNANGEILVAGIPPVLNLGMDSNHLPLLKISGTVGATLTIQTSTNPASQSSWTTLTNLALTNGVGGTNQNSSLVSLAFPPASQNYEVVDSAPATGEFYQLMMPYDYMVLADANLSGQGLPSRLLLVRMPGTPAADVCYVTPQSSFLYYDATNRAFAVEASGSTIRQVATTLSTWLGQNWTSASEFSFSNGVSSILATVVETEPANSDPVAAPSAPSISIDF